MNDVGLMVSHRLTPHAYPILTARICWTLVWEKAWAEKSLRRSLLHPLLHRLF